MRYRKLFEGYEEVENMFPGPPTVPIFGNALQFFGSSHHLHEHGLLIARLYRKTFRVYLGPKLLICLQQPDDIEAVLNNTEHINKSSIYDGMVPFLRRGLITSDGPKWHRHRRVLTPAFHVQVLEGFIDIFNKNAQIMSEIFTKKVGQPSFQIQDYTMLCALDNIAETAMGVSLNAQLNPALEYTEALKTMLHIVFLRALRPWYVIDFIFENSKYSKQQKKALKILHGYSWKVLSQRVKERKEQNYNKNKAPGVNEVGMKSKKVLLDLLLDYHDEGALTLEEVHEEIDTFMGAGHDTVTAALAYAIYYLAHLSNIQERASQEQDEIFGKDTREPTVADLNRMKYLELVIKETLRLAPSAPIYGRTIQKDLKLDEYRTIPAGAEAIITVPAIHRNPDLWENPLKFDPERFLPENLLKRSPYSYVPFSLGPRNCIGIKFAMLEMKATLSKLLRTFHLKPSNPVVNLKFGIEVVLVSHTGVNISLDLKGK